MRIRIAVTMLALAGALHCRDAAAQATTNATNQVMFRVAFSASCVGFDSTRGRVVTTRITDRTIIAQATGGNPSHPGVNQGFALVFNTTEDSLQVVDAQGNPVVDVIHFGGGSATGDARQTDRLTFMFFPGQTNEFGAETNVFGTTLITERGLQSTSSGAAARAHITGRLQFTLSGNTPLGTTNLTSDSGTNAHICVGVFTTSRRFPLSTLAAVAAMNTTATTGTTTTNSPGIRNPIPVVVVATPATSILTPSSAGTSTTFLDSTAGMLPSLTADGALPGLEIALGTGLIPLTPFTPITTIALGAPIGSNNVPATTTSTISTLTTP